MKQWYELYVLQLCYDIILQMRLKPLSKRLRNVQKGIRQYEIYNIRAFKSQAEYIRF